MRTLVTGSIGTDAIRIASAVVTDSKEAGWTVISSFQSSLDQVWSTHAQVKVSHAAKDAKDVVPDPNTPFVLEVTSSSSLPGKPWFKARFTSAVSTVVVCPNPISCIDRECLAAFDTVMITKTPQLDRISQYYTLFVSPKKDFADFKRELKAISNGSYMTVSNKGNTLTTKALAGTTPTPQSTPAPPAATLIKDRTDEPTTKDEHVDGSTLKDDPTTTELWVCLTVNPKVTLTDAIGEFQTMLSNELIVSMLSANKKDNAYKTDSKDHTVSVYVRVIQRRQDLFSAILVSMLQSLRAADIIVKGSLVVV